MRDLTSVEQLRAAKELIKDPAHWTQCAFARDSEGTAVSFFDESAVCWCALGATGMASIDWGGCGTYVEALWSAAAPRKPNEVNDSGTHEDVMKMFDKAIALAEEETK